MKVSQKLYISFLGVILVTIVLVSIISTGLRSTIARGAISGAVTDVLAGASSIAIGLSLAAMVSKSIAEELRSLAAATKVVSEGNLARDIPVRREDELGDLALAFNRMVGSLREIVREVQVTAEAVTDSALALSSSTEQMNTSTEEIAKTVEQIAKGTEHQANLVEQFSRVMREMAGSINEIAVRARSTADAASEAGYTAQTGGKSVKEAMSKMKEVFGIIEASTLTVKSFSEKAKYIGTIVDVITKIAQQTHLLALNAAIEAAKASGIEVARAGEYGRGFAVIAEEIRKLATEAGHSAEEIAKIVKELQEGNAQVLASMEIAVKEIDSGKEVLAATGEALEEIVHVILEKVKQIQEISHLTQQQTRGAEELVKTIDEIAKVAQDNAASTEEVSDATAEQTASMERMAASVQELKALSDRLKVLISKFKVGEEGAG